MLTNGTTAFVIAVGMLATAGAPGIGPSRAADDGKQLLLTAESGGQTNLYLYSLNSEAAEPPAPA